MLSFQEILQAQQSISPYVKKTPVTLSEFFSRELGLNIFFKWENQQKTKSFKIRGALNKILSLKDDEKAKGLITASAGNHAQGVALAAKITKVHSKIVMMKRSSKIKIESTKKLGAQVILYGDTYDESYQYAKKIQQQEKLLFIHPFFDPVVMAGQGTMGLEIIKDLPNLDSIVVPIGGGGLITGVATAIKKLKPNCKVYAVAWEGTPSYCHQFHHVKNQLCKCQNTLGKPFVSNSGLSDGIAVKKPDSQMYSYFSFLLDNIFCVSEGDISKEIVRVFLREKQVVEGSGVSALAGMVKHKNKLYLGKNCCVIISGGNIDLSMLNQLVKQGSV